MTMDFKNLEVSSVEDWIELGADKHHILIRDIEQTQKTIFGRQDDIKESFCPDPALVTSIGEEPEFAGRNVTVLTPLTEHYYLARTHVPRHNVIFLILDDRRIGSIVAKFYWDLTFYWSSFGYGRPGGCMPSGIYATYTCTRSCHGNYVIIVGPTEVSRNRRKALPAAKLLLTSHCILEAFQLTECEWPAQVVFDPRPQEEHVVYLVQSPHGTFTPQYSRCQGTLHRYSLRERHSQCQFGPVLSGFVQCLQDGSQLLVLRPQEERPSILDSLAILDSRNLCVLLHLGQPTAVLSKQVDLFSQMKAFYSADYKHISVVLWERMYKEECIISNVLTLTPVRSCGPLMSLKASCRAAILASVQSKQLAKLTLPKPLQAFLKGL